MLSEIGALGDMCQLGQMINGVRNGASAGPPAPGAGAISTSQALLQAPPSVVADAPQQSGKMEAAVGRLAG
eukprot:10021985-Karenia_brevis.AAC.1